MVLVCKLPCTKRYLRYRWLTSFQESPLSGPEQFWYPGGPGRNPWRGPRHSRNNDNLCRADCYRMSLGRITNHVFVRLLGTKQRARSFVCAKLRAKKRPRPYTVRPTAASQMRSSKSRRANKSHSFDSVLLQKEGRRSLRVGAGFEPRSLMKAAGSWSSKRISKECCRAK